MDDVLHNFRSEALLLDHSTHSCESAPRWIGLNRSARIAKNACHGVERAC